MQEGWQRVYREDGREKFAGWVAEGMQKGWQRVCRYNGREYAGRVCRVKSRGYA